MDKFINEKLFAAVESGDAAKVKEMLIEEGKVIASSFFGYKSIVCAAEKGYAEILKMLLDSNAKANRESFWSNSHHTASVALKYASYNGHTEIVKLLLEYGANAVKSDMTGALNEALLNGNFELVRILQEAGAKINVNIKDDNGITPLIYAVLFPNENQKLIVETLLAAGADVNAKDRKHCSALMYAEKTGNTQIVEMLQNAGKYR